jgi:hypothetical protein
LTGKVVDHIKGGLVVERGRARVSACFAGRPAPSGEPGRMERSGNHGSRGEDESQARQRGREPARDSRGAIVKAIGRSCWILWKKANRAPRRGEERHRPTARSSIWADIDGLLHITDMSWGRVTSPLGRSCGRATKSKCKMLKYDKEKARVALGLKQLMPPIRG